MSRVFLALLITSLCLPQTAWSNPIVLASRSIDPHKAPLFTEDLHHHLRSAKHPASQKHQFLVRFVHPVHHDSVAAAERELGVTFDYYVPHSTFVLYATDEKASQALRLRSVAYIGVFRSADKLSPSINDLLSKKLAADVLVLLAVQTVRLTPEERSEFIHRWSTQLESASEVDFVVHASAEQLEETVSRLLQEPAVHRVEEKVTRFTSHNAYLRWVVESNLPSAYLAEASGLSGAGQVIGMGDSGVDLSNCFFKDPVNGFNPSGSTYIDANARKVIYYNASQGDFSDGTGHGSAVAGTAVGFDYHPSSTLNNWKGVAPDAKLAVMDLNTIVNGAEIVPPADLGSDYMAPLYAQNARVILSAFGAASTLKSYSTLEQQVDEFVYSHPTTVAVFAAGNDGSLGAGAVSVPSTSKNCISVGASQSSSLSFQANINYAAYDSLYNTLVQQLCTGAAASTDALWSDASFCEAVGTGSWNGTLPCFYQSDSWCPFMTTVSTPPSTTCCNVPGSARYFANITSALFCCGDVLVNSYLNLPEIYGAASNLASFSSRGPTFDGRIKPDLCAPGEPVVTAAVLNSSSPTGSENCGAWTGPGSISSALGISTGTSLSAAAVAGAAALVREYFMAGYYPGGFENSGAQFEPSASLVKAVLISSAQSLNSISGSFAGFGKPSWGTTVAPDVNQGFGRLQLDATLYFNSSSYVSNLFSNMRVIQGNLSTGEDFKLCLTAAFGSSMTITLVWTDPAAATSAGIALVNNLDLFVSKSSVDPSNPPGVNTAAATVIAPNGGNGPDALNNVEKVALTDLSQAPVIDSIFITILGTSVPKGPQSFSLVVVGDFTEGCTAPFTCPRLCSLHGQCDTNTGLCNCADSFTGPDCSFSPCSTNCSGNGACTATGNCVCSALYTGADCSQLVALSPSSSTNVIVTRSSHGVRGGAVAGIAVAVFIFGALLGFGFGVFAGLKYTEHRRKQKQKEANRILTHSM